MATQRDRISGTDGERSLRATTADRERVLAELSDATARGQIDLGEFDERSAVAWSTPSRAGLADLVADIVVDPMAVVLGDMPGVALPQPDRRSTGLTPVHGATPGVGAVDARTTGRPGSAWTVAVMSDAGKKGEWACSRSHRVAAVMGGALVDLRDAVFEAPETVITVTAVMGGVQVLVPEDVRVVEHGLGLMGSFTSARATSVTRSSRDLPGDAPWSGCAVSPSWVVWKSGVCLAAGGRSRAPETARPRVPSPRGFSLPRRGPAGRRRFPGHAVST
ncbi:DUF1707 SHOCT-like domain-containing protein [Corynebacterium kalidii]